MERIIKSDELKHALSTPEDKVKLYIGVLELAAKELPEGKERSEVLIELKALRKYAKERSYECGS